MKTINISEIANIREKAKSIMEVSRKIHRPILDDLNLLPRIYGVFCDSSNMNGVYQVSFTKTQIFLFVVLYLYSPGTLFGDKLPGGMRKEIAKILGVKAESTVSDKCKDLLFVYTNYIEFRTTAEVFYNEVCEVLGI